MSSLRYMSQTLTDAVAAGLLLAKTRDDVEALKHCKAVGSVSLNDVRLLASLLRAEHGDCSSGGPRACGLWVHELMSGAKPLLPEPNTKPPPHPDLEPRLKRLRAAQEDREYAQMMGTNLADDDSIGRDAAEMNTFRSQISVGVNLIVSMITMFIVGAYGGGTVEEPYGVRAVVCGLLLMILTLAVEITLFLIGAIRVDTMVHKRERRAWTKGVSDRTKLAQLNRGVK